MRELVNETDRVGHDDRLAIAELGHARCRIERGEKLVLGQGGVLPDQRVEDRGLAGVRVADYGYCRHESAVARPCGRVTLTLHVVDAVLQLLDLLADDAPVGFELRLAGAAGADAALCPRQVGPQPREAWQ